MKRVYFALFPILFLIISCATSNMPGIEQYNPVPENRAYSELYPFAENGNIIFKRDSGFMGSALGAVIFINNEKVAQFSPGQFYQIQLPEGVYFVSLKSGEGVNLGTAFERTIKLDVTNSRQRTIRIFPMPTQGMVMEEVYN